MRAVWACVLVTTASPALADDDAPQVALAAEVGAVGGGGATPGGMRVGGRYHVDGGLRQNTPLRPVLKAGVDRALVIGLKQAREEEAQQHVGLVRGCWWQDS